MNIGTYCKHRVVTIAPHADLAEAAELMRTQHVGMLVVLRPGDRRAFGPMSHLPRHAMVWSSTGKLRASIPCFRVS